MRSGDHPWEVIYRKKGREYVEPFPGFGDVVDIFAERARGRVLDLGCGNGRHLLGFVQRDLKTCGMDISLSGLRLAREWLDEESREADVVCSDMRIPFPFGDSSFAGVFSTQVIHHARMAQVRNAISEIHRILDSGGIAFVTVSGHTGDDEYEEIEPGTIVPLSGDEKGLPHHIFSYQELEDEFRKFNIEDISVRADGKVLAILAEKHD